MAMQTRIDRSRQLILAAADCIFREAGFDGASMEAIAVRAGLTRKTVYNLFRSKEDVALHLLARVEADDARYRKRMAANHDAIKLLEIVLSDSAAWCLANPALARLALAPPVRPSLHPPTDRPSFQGLVTDILEMGQRQGVVRTDENPNFLSLVLLGIYGQAMLSALIAGSIKPSEIRKIIRIVFEGIQA